MQTSQPLAVECWWGAQPQPGYLCTLFHIIGVASGNLCCPCARKERIEARETKPLAQGDAGGGGGVSTKAGLSRKPWVCPHLLWSPVSATIMVYTGVDVGVGIVISPWLSFQNCHGQVLPTVCLNQQTLTGSQLWDHKSKIKGERAGSLQRLCGRTWARSLPWFPVVCWSSWRSSHHGGPWPVAGSS